MAPQSKKSLTDAELTSIAERIQAGDREAFGIFYDAYLDKIYRYIYFKVEQEDVEDLTEMAFLKVWDNIALYKKGTAPFTSWVFRIVHNMIVDYYRLKRRVLDLSDETPDESVYSNPKELTENNITQAHVRLALNKVRPLYQQILVMKFITGLSNEEIASVLGRRCSAVRVLQFRALKALKKVLTSMGFSDYGSLLKS